MTTYPGVSCYKDETLFFFFACIFRQAFLQKGFAAAMLCTVIAMTLYVLFNFLFGVFFGLTPLDRIFGACITAGLSLIAAPILYPIFLSIGSIGGEAWKE